MRRTILLISILSSVVLTVPAQAAIVTVQASGTINRVDAGLAGNPFFGLLDAFSLTFTYDDQAIDSISDPLAGLYSNAIQSFALTYGTYSTTHSGAELFVSNDRTITDDQFSFVGFAGTVVSNSGSINSSFSYNQTQFLLRDTTRSAFSSDALNGLALDLSDFTSATISTTFFEPIGPNSVRTAVVAGNITSLSVSGLGGTTPPVSDVPLPAAAPLMLFGLSALGFFGFNRKRDPALRFKLRFRTFPLRQNLPASSS